MPVKKKIKEKDLEANDFSEYVLKQHAVLNKESAHLSPDERLKVNIYRLLKILYLNWE